MPTGNDQRGWILTCISAAACALGASFICVDLIVRLFPGKKNFKLQDSNAFLSCSLSLSAGVMLYSSLYKMLSEAATSMKKGGMAPKPAAWALIGLFLAGVFGIRVLSHFIHQCMPSHVVDCDHSHDDEEEEEEDEGHYHHRQHESHSHNHNSNKQNGETKKPNGHTERTPLLDRSISLDGTTIQEHLQPEMTDLQKATLLVQSDRPTLRTRTSQTLGRVSKFVTGSKHECDVNGPCFGYSDPCGRECFRNINARGGARAAAWGNLGRRSPPFRHSNTMNSVPAARVAAARQFQNIGAIDEEAAIGAPTMPPRSVSAGVPQMIVEEPTDSILDGETQPNDRTPTPHHDDHNSHHEDDQNTDNESETNSQRHHHHVPQNAFLALSFQTSIAIAVHKLPEGFITYATNHANPKLGFTVFLALAIHNISEGFGLALPLFLATQSHVRALFYSFILGGLSQPLGAGIAALTLKFAERGRGEWAPGERVYGGMFAVTAGIMASVALSLLQESLELGHKKGLCIAFCFVGIGIIGASGALTA